MSCADPEAALDWVVKYMGASPILQKRGPVADGSMVDLAPGHALPIQLYWHCWNLESVVLDALTAALTATAAKTLTQP